MSDVEARLSALEKVVALKMGESDRAVLDAELDELRQKVNKLQKGLTYILDRMEGWKK